MARAFVFTLVVIAALGWGCAPAHQHRAATNEPIDLAVLAKAGARKIWSAVGKGETGAVSPARLSSIEGLPVRELIEQGEVAPGMTKEQVLLAKGKPEAVSVIEGGWGITEQWVYGGYKPDFVYFTNGRVTVR